MIEKTHIQSTARRDSYKKSQKTKIITLMLLKIPRSKHNQHHAGFPRDIPKYRRTCQRRVSLHSDPKAMARFLGVTKQTVSRKLKFHVIGAPYKILHKHCITKNHKPKAVPVRYYELDALYQIAVSTDTAKALRVASILKDRNSRYNIAKAVINRRHMAVICLD